MKDLKKGFKSLGIELKITTDKDLKQYKKGKPLLARELEALPDNSIVWCIYIDRVNGPYRIKHLPEYGRYFVSLNDGSSFAADFNGSDIRSDLDKCIDYHDKGELQLFKAIVR